MGETERAMQPCKNTSAATDGSQRQHEDEMKTKQVSENLQNSSVLPLQGTFKGW